MLKRQRGASLGLKFFLNRLSCGMFFKRDEYSLVEKAAGLVSKVNDLKYLWIEMNILFANCFFLSFLGFGYLHDHVEIIRSREAEESDIWYTAVDFV